MPMTIEEQLRELTYSLRRLSEIVESDSQRREKEYIDVTKRLEKNHVAVEKLLMVLDKLSDRVEGFDAEGILFAIRQAIDDYRPSTSVNGIEAWSPNGQAHTHPVCAIEHKHSEPSTALTTSAPAPAPVATTEKREITAKFTIDDSGEATLHLGKLSWARTLSILKWSMAALATGTGVGTAAKLLLDALLGL